ncbi:acetyltransferase (GNAT) family protein [Stackebrandtia albiflava]|uniref:Acetyltransferase (GNAT) family protein n=1 Tax=Stackebrandtia albiflava TaxID=406432 RepID=A0A562V4R4_9ACTN|nr:GNAT family N-acetyltransferase [Stackebrandtia albiflava]TWJ12822.1 acetyltransferase (GNAT) family protein [Stackebrandtia albiflava]
MTHIRLATADDIAPAADTLAEAFDGYAFTRHTVAADGHRDRLRRFQRLFLERIGLPYGRVWVADDHAAVAVWTTPATAAAGDVFAGVAAELIDIAGDRARQHADAEAVMARHRPTEPVWFLGTIGVRPDRQGAGLGRAVIAPGLAEAAREGVPAFLETSIRRNVTWYESLGFRVTADYDLPDGGPHTWSMLRPPSAE